MHAGSVNYRSNRWTAFGTSAKMEPPSPCSRAFDAAHLAWLGCRVDAIPLRLHSVSSRSAHGHHRRLDASCCLAVSDAWVALPNFYNIAIRIANVAPCLAVLGLRLRDELGASTAPLLIARLNIRNPYVHKAADPVRVRGDAERYRWLVRCWTAAGVNKEPGV